MAKLLVVEDDNVLRRGLEKLLDKTGYTVVAAVTGKAALEELDSFVPDLVVADVLLPGISGVDLAEAVRARSKWKDLPFLFITAQNMPRIEERIAALSNASILYKPFEPAQLAAALKAALDGR